jgi:two-component sensor histidine kinase
VNPEAAFDLFLETTRGAGSQLVRRLVQQQDGGRVDSEDLDDPVEQRLEQRIQLEICECRFGNPLEVPRQARG